MQAEIIEDSAKQEKWFSTKHLNGNLKSHSVKGGFSTIGGQLVSFLLNISSTVFMARLLSPEDYGLVAMVTAITGFVVIFKDMGLSAAVIQREHIDQKQVSAVFWINAGISLGIGLIIAALAPFLVDFYKEPRLLDITLVFAASIFVTGLSLQHNALMKRQMKFQALSMIQIGCTAVSVLLGILLAWLGFGYWAIVAYMVLNPVISVAVLWLTCDWRPSFSVKALEVGALLRFGAGITGFDMVNYFSRNMDYVLIGRYVGSGALGVYTKAYQLLLLPITQLRDPLNSVALPALSSLQNDKYKYQAFYRRFLFTLSFFSMPLVVFMAVYAEELILTVLGNQWVAAGPIFRLLAFAAFIQPSLSTIGLVLITSGMVKRYFWWGVINAVVVVTAFFIGVQWGVQGVAIAYAVVTYLLLFPALLFCFRQVPVTTAMFLKEISLPALFSLASGAAMFLFKLNFGQLPDIALCAAGFAVGAACYLLAWCISKQSRAKANQIFDIASTLMNRFKV
ncbi:lipopolysaccharide biosynthesis protein [Pontibacter akesuensis]|uniref:Membrane protein involved in the export of O-antigen and teichoic acid n=1 Tax=Pontibacter akesuensis TaxID=388950 RepID=A0A1I7GHH3_9BACT|nr:lipopolysaccharide biosynthesis protein [Pontibacter akesuensis]GHA56802.1 lipopolysaccharide biosynthesis protein [Pontibacter akesuensis]SFU47883.1 Membrane protein involved in the export of O-antigen and teichoic acid [Pontibacter akesuensis]